MNRTHIPLLGLLMTLVSAEALAVSPAAPSPWQTSWQATSSGSVSQSVGKPAEGALRKGLRLPASGPGFSRRARGQHYGTDETISLIRFAAARLAEAYPQSAPLLVGDISRRRGGALSPHRSHQSGRDVDIALPERINQPRHTFNPRLRPSEIDYEKLWFTLDVLIASNRVQFVFLDSSLLPPLRKEALLAGWSPDELMRLFGKQGARRGVIRHAPGHTCHMHVRFHCPEGDSDCTP